MKRPRTSTVTDEVNTHNSAACGCQVCARARQQNAQLPVIRESKKFWLDDGLVVLQVENTRYRLHKGQLMRQSSFFRKLFEDDPTSGNEVSNDSAAKPAVADGHVYMINEGVSSAEFEAMLECIDQGLLYAFSLPSFPQIVAILRAASALSFRAPFVFAKRAMEVMWSGDLDKLTDTPLQHAAIAVHLATEYNLGPAVRKRALYELLRQEDFAQARPWSKCGKEVNVYPDLVPEGIAAYEELEGISISPFIQYADFLLLFLVRIRLQSEWRTTTKTAHGVSDFCPNAIDGCKALSEHPVLWPKVIKEFEIIGLIDPLSAFQKIHEYDWEAQGYCKSCIEGIKRWCADEQVRIWTLLDGWLTGRRGSARDGSVGAEGDDSEGAGAREDRDEQTFPEAQHPSGHAASNSLVPRIRQSTRKRFKTNVA